MIIQKSYGMWHKPYPKSGTLVALAGAESKQFRALFKEAGVKHILLSYYYLRRQFNQSKQSIEELKADLKDFEFVIMDSGGYTLQRAVAENKLDVDLEEFTAEYYEFAHKMKGYITWFGMVDSVTEKHDIYELYDWCFEAKKLELHVAPTVFGMNSWAMPKAANLIDNFDTLGFSRDKKNSALTDSLAVRLSRTNMLHGYAMTSPDELRSVSFRSVDSTTWLGGQKYGTTYIFQNGRIRTVAYNHKHSIRKYLWSLCEKHGIDYTLIEKEEAEFKKHKTVSKEIYKEINKLNLIAWTQFADFLYKKPTRAYWLKKQWLQKFGLPKLYNYDEVTGMTEKIPDDPELEALLDSIEEDNVEEENFEVPPDDDTPAEKEIFSVGNIPTTEISDSATSLFTSSKNNFFLECTNCFIGDRCGYYKEGAKCSIDFSNKETSLEGLSKSLLTQQSERINRALLFEAKSGGIIDPTLSQEITRLNQMIGSHIGFFTKQSQKSSITIQAEGEASTQAGGILSKLLGIPSEKVIETKVS